MSEGRAIEYWESVTREALGKAITKNPKGQLFGKYDWTDELCLRIREVHRDRERGTRELPDV